MESYREQFNLILPPKGTGVYIEYMAGSQFSIIWPACPDGENILYGWISSKAKAQSIVDEHKWIDITELQSIVEKQKQRIQNLKSKDMEYKLVVKELGTGGSGKYIYKVIDENGTVIKERRSNREYVACTVFHNFYFGRMDLIGKGDHGRSLRMDYWKSKPEEFKKLNIIAYK